MTHEPENEVVAYMVERDGVPFLIYAADEENEAIACAVRAQRYDPGAIFGISPLVRADAPHPDDRIRALITKLTRDGEA